MVCPYSLTIPGGVQGQVLGLARALRADGHACTVLAPCDGPPPDSGVIGLGPSIPLASNGSVAPLSPGFACASRTLAALRDGDFDVVHLHEPLCPGPTLTALLRGRTPLVGTFHRAGGSAAYTAFRPVVRRLAGRLSARVAVSEDARATAVHALGGEYEVLFNGIEMDRFAQATPAPSPVPAVLFIGRHEERKGLAVLLDAVAGLPLDVRIWIAGEGPETERLRATTAGDERIEWLGRVTDPEAAALMRGATVFCAPSLRGESFGVVLLEAMAAGTAIVASDLPGYRNVARPDTDAVLVPPGDAPALAAGLRRVLSDGDCRERLVTSGSARADAFSMARLAQSYADLYERVVAASP